MTRLTDFAAVLLPLTSIWIALCVKLSHNDFVKDYPQVRLGILYLPLICLVCFGIYSAIVVLYRTFNFNDCKTAALELHKDIQEARQDLAKQGFKF